MEGGHISDFLYKKHKQYTISNESTVIPCGAHINLINHYLIISFTKNSEATETGTVLANYSRPNNLKSISLSIGGSVLQTFNVLDRDYTQLYEVYLRAHRDFSWGQNYVNYETFLEKAFSVCFRLRDIRVNDRISEYRVSLEFESGSLSPQDLQALRMNVFISSQRGFKIDLMSGVSTLEG
jgi:hypothetical protein